MGEHENPAEFYLELVTVGCASCCLDTLVAAFETNEREKQQRQIEEHLQEIRKLKDSERALPSSASPFSVIYPQFKTTTRYLCR